MGDRLDAARRPGPRPPQGGHPLLALGDGDVAAFLLAHPDDESFFTGGTLALLDDGVRRERRRRRTAWPVAHGGLGPVAPKRRQRRV